MSAGFGLTLELGHDPADTRDAPGSLLDLARDLLAGDDAAQEDLAGRVDRDLDVALGGGRVAGSHSSAGAFCGLPTPTGA